MSGASGRRDRGITLYSTNITPPLPAPPPPGEKGGWGKGRREKEGAPKEEIKNFLFAKVIAYLKKSEVLFDEKLT